MPRFTKGSDEAKAYMKSIREGRKLKTNYEKMKGHEDLIMTNTAQIAVPKTLLHIDGNGEQKIIKTVTKSGNLTRRDKKPVIKIEPKTENELKIINQGKTKKERSTGLLKEVNIDLDNRKNKKINQVKENLDKLPSKKTKTLFTNIVRDTIAKKKTKKIVDTPIETNNYDNNDTYLNDWLGITKKSINDSQFQTTKKDKDVIEYTDILDQMFDEIDTKYTKDEIKSKIEALNINMEPVSDYVYNWYQSKVSSGKNSPEYTDFCRLVIYPSLVKNTPKDKLTNEDKFVLMMYTNDIASDAHFQKYTSDQQFKTRVVLQFIRPKPIGTLQFVSFISSNFKSLYNKYIEFNI